MPKTTDIPTGAPCWIDLSTSDRARSNAFYGALFGWTVDDPGPEYGGYTNYLTDGVQVAGCMQAMDGAPDAWGVYLSVPDAEKVAANAPGVIAPAMPVMTLGTMAIVTDPGGAVIGVWQPAEHRGFGVLAEPGAPAWFELHTRAYDECVAFYTDVFGWDARTMSDDPTFRYTTYGEGETARAGIMDAASSTADADAGWSIYFSVVDADAAVAQAMGLGASVVDQPEDTPYGRLATLVDPNGARFKLMADIAS